MDEEIEDRLSRIEARLTSLEGARPGRKAKPIVRSEEGVCGVEPGTDSSICPFASLYRRQEGCKGVACMAKSSKYYADRRGRPSEG
jgi:hypothetical protein